MFVSPRNAYVEALTPKCDSSWGWGFGGVDGKEILELTKENEKRIQLIPQLIKHSSRHQERGCAPALLRGAHGALRPCSPHC